MKLPKLFNGKDEMYVGSLSKYPGVSHNVVYGTVVLVFFCLELRVSNSDEEFSFFILRSCQKASESEKRSKHEKWDG